MGASSKVVGTKTRGSTFNQSGIGWRSHEWVWGQSGVTYLIVSFRVSVSHFLEMTPLRDSVLLEKSVRCGDGSPL